MVRYDVFANTVKGRVIGTDTPFQLELPDVATLEIKTNLKKFSRIRKASVREFIYVPWEESA